MEVQAAEVLAMIQRALCLIGSASEISRARRAKILEAIDPAWNKFTEDSFPSAKGTLFGEDGQGGEGYGYQQSDSNFQEKPERAHSCYKEGGEQIESFFFRGGPPGRYGTRQGRSFFPVQHICSKRTDTRLWL